MKLTGIAISAGRSDYDRFYPILRSLNNSKKFDIYIYLTKDHFSKKYGYTHKYVSNQFQILHAENSKFSNFKLSEFTDDLMVLIKYVNKIKPKVIFVMGDRYEMLLGPLVSIPLKIPIIHFYGGAVTEGSSDELVRHAITKMSHFHFVATNEYRERLLQLGEESWRVKKIGVLNLQKIKRFKFLNKKEISVANKFNFHLPYAVLTYHPTTHELEKILKTMNFIKKAIELNKLNLVITYPNSDLKNQTVINFIKKNFKNKKKFKIIKNCGFSNFLNIVKNSEFMIGNSSAGIVESATLKIPSINIGSRQNGKLMSKNVINVDNKFKEISEAIKKIRLGSFKRIVEKLKSPYEDNFKSEKVIKIISKMLKRKDLLKKKFINIK
jgi:GDP/UDP-N,N'-diacetylbacillosamine 2-epimerase (hydrolysing)